MKKVIGIFLMTVTIMACQQNKLGFVDTVELLKGYQEKTELDAKVTTRAEALTKKRDSLSQAFQLELNEFQTKAKKMSQKTAQEEYALLQQRGQFVGQQLQQEELLLQQESQVEMDSLASKVKREIKAYGKANNFNYVFTAGQGGAVLYGDETQDLTQEVLKILNDKYRD